MSETQFRTWWAYHLFVEPLESARMDRRFGLLLSCLEAMLLGSDSFSPDKFFLGWRDQDNTEPDAESAGADWRLMQARFEQVCMAFNAAQQGG